MNGRNQILFLSIFIFFLSPIFAQGAVNDLDPFDSTDADEDPDDDGLSNLEEFIEGSDPHDAEDPNSGFLSYDYIFGIIGIVILPLLIRVKRK